MIIKKVKGCLYCIFDNTNNIYLNLVPSNYIKNQKDRDGNEHHITIINSNELSKFDYEPKNRDINILDLEKKDFFFSPKIYPV